MARQRLPPDDGIDLGPARRRSGGLLWAVVLVALVALLALGLAAGALGRPRITNSDLRTLGDEVLLFFLRACRTSVSAVFGDVDDTGERRADGQPQAADLPMGQAATAAAAPGLAGLLARVEHTLPLRMRIDVVVDGNVTTTTAALREVVLGDTSQVGLTAQSPGSGLLDSQGLDLRAAAVTLNASGLVLGGEQARLVLRSPELTAWPLGELLDLARVGPAPAGPLQRIRGVRVARQCLKVADDPAQGYRLVQRDGVFRTVSSCVATNCTAVPRAAPCSGRGTCSVWAHPARAALLDPASATDADPWFDPIMGLCECQEGYAGDYCERCAAGFQRTPGGCRRILANPICATDPLCRSCDPDTGRCAVCLDGYAPDTRGRCTYCRNQGGERYVLCDMRQPDNPHPAPSESATALLSEYPSFQCLRAPPQDAPTTCTTGSETFNPCTGECQTCGVAGLRYDASCALCPDDQVFCPSSSGGGCAPPKTSPFCSDWDPCTGQCKTGGCLFGLQLVSGECACPAQAPDGRQYIWCEAQGRCVDRSSVVPPESCLNYDVCANRCLECAARWQLDEAEGVCGTHAHPSTPTHPALPHAF